MPLKVKVTPPREGGGRVMSATDASKSKSTPPKTGTDAQIQRMNNTIKSLIGSGLSKGVIGSMYRNALEGAKGNNVSNADKQAMKNAKKDPKSYKGKAYGGKTKMMAGGKARKK
jgi:hypothetical protein